MRSAARRRTEAARGLAAISSASVPLAAAVEQPQLRLAPSGGTGSPAGVGSVASSGERLLHDPVLQRLIGQHDDPPPCSEHVQRDGDGRLSAASSPFTSMRSA